MRVNPLKMIRSQTMVLYHDCTLYDNVINL